ncbi:AVID protein, partial [Cochlearius cochlearius]|nr:AVID protein [Cochlearius cochlearius]
WINDLGSNMTIAAGNAKGEFTGSYHMAVTATMNEIQVSPPQGSQHLTSQKSQPTFSFTVNWSFSVSSTTSVGQCFVDEDGKETLRTMWIMQDEGKWMMDERKVS